MQKRIVALTALLLCLLAVAQVVYASPGIVFSKNDFDQTHYTVWVGTAVFSSAGITLTPDTTQHKCFVENIHAELNGTDAYLYYDITPTYTSQTVEQTFELYLKQGNTTINVQLVYYPTNVYKFRLTVNDTAVNTVLISSLPKTGILGWDGQTAYLYSNTGTKIAQVSRTSAVSGELSHFGFVAYYATVKVNGYVLADDLQTAKSQGLTQSTTSTVLAFIPLLLTFAMLSVALVMIKKVQ